MLIGLTLFSMFVIMIFSMIVGNESIGTIIDNSYGGYMVVNGTKTSLESAPESSVFFIDPVLGVVGMFIIIVAIVGLLGLQLFGSGFSDYAIRVISTCIIYGGLWALVSVLSMPMVVLIEGFGAMIYVALTMGYVYGVIEKFRGGK